MPISCVRRSPLKPAIGKRPSSTIARQPLVPLRAVPTTDSASHPPSEPLRVAGVQQYSDEDKCSAETDARNRPPKGGRSGWPAFVIHDRQPLTLSRSQTAFGVAVARRGEAVGDDVPELALPQSVAGGLCGRGCELWLCRRRSQTHRDQHAVHGVDHALHGVPGDFHAATKGIGNVVRAQVRRVGQAALLRHV